MIKPYTQKDILVLINNGTCFDPRYITDVLPEDIKQKIRDLIKREPKVIKRYLNYTSLLEQCKDHRPDLYPLFNNIRYKNWTNRMIRIIQTTISRI